MNSTLLAFEKQTSLAAALAGRISDSLSAAIEKRQKASLFVSGGTTPVPMFEALSHVDLAWDRVDIALVDERWVDVTGKDSNEHLVRTHLLKDKAGAAAFTGMKTAAKTALAGEEACAARYSRILPPYDVIVLGMGADGHTASLFPGAAGLPAAVDMSSGRICMAIAPATAAHERMTLTLPAILNAGEIFVHISGAEKQNVYEAAMAEGPRARMPIRYVLRQEKVPVTVFWTP